MDACVQRPWSVGRVIEVEGWVFEAVESTLQSTLGEDFVLTDAECQTLKLHGGRMRFHKKHIWEAAKVIFTKNTTTQHNTQPCVQRLWSRKFYTISFRGSVGSTLHSTLQKDLDLTGIELQCSDDQELYILLFPEGAVWKAALKILKTPLVTETVGSLTGGTATHHHPVAKSNAASTSPPKEAATQRDPTKPLAPGAGIRGRSRRRNRTTKTKHQAVQSQGEMITQHKPLTKAPGVGQPALSKHGSVYVVYKVTGSRWRGRKRFEYQVWWEGYDQNDCTWEPLNNFITDGSRETILEFHRQKPKSPVHPIIANLIALREGRTVRQCT
ncbi:hypothetical protein B0T14DRAFT_511744 [Immersiella caudata]|uniref:Chromo domain-containing protein n=1 Tax=Immersiella caudata TaxID=314043 RepID=A0AA40C698_9PEZI|nr:hypothetical protein B0T14DRAFT_511744 [Immersiella caudata]